MKDKDNRTPSARNRTRVSIPARLEEMSELDAALAYAAVGIYVLPVVPENKNGRTILKNPGSVVGKNWPAFSTRDPKQIRAWWKRHPTAAVAGDMGKSGLVAFDVDNPDNLPERLKPHLTTAPMQSTRADDPERGHYVFRLRLGESVRCSTGTLGKNWGEVRSAGGVIMLSPSTHEKASEGGEYRWRRTGRIPLLPSVVREELATATGSEVPLSNTQLKAFRARYSDEDETASLIGPIRWFTEQIADPSVSRHEALVNVLCWVFEEARVGCYSADAAYDAVEEVFREAVEAPSAAGDGSVRDRRPFFRSELDGAAAWAAAQAEHSDPDELRDKIQRRRSAVTEDREFEHELRRLRIRERARVAFATEQASQHSYVLPRETLSEALARPREEVPHRIEGLHRVGYNSTISGRYKVGKTHLNANKLRSLADDVPFLDRFEVLPPDGRIGVLNYELDEGEFFEWLRSVGILKTDRVAPLNLRGRKFSLANPYNVAELIDWCQAMEIEVLDLDPHRRAFSGFGKENDNDDVNRFTEVLDEIKTAAGVRDLFLYVHMGREQHEEGNEHARGATALDDWADQRWLLTKNRDNNRFLYTDGRLPEVPEFQVRYDPETRRLSAAEGNRRESAEALLVQRAQQAINKNPGINTNELIADLKLSRGPAATGLRDLLQEGAPRLWKLVKDRRGNYWFPANFTGEAEQVIAHRRARKTS